MCSRSRWNIKFGNFTLSFGRLREIILLKCVPHVQHDYFSPLNQSDHCFLASSLPLPLLSSLLKVIQKIVRLFPPLSFAVPQYFYVRPTKPSWIVFLLHLNWEPTMLFNCLLVFPKNYIDAMRGIFIASAFVWISGSLASVDEKVQNWMNWERRTAVNFLWLGRDSWSLMVLFDEGLFEGARF